MPAWCDHGRITPSSPLLAMLSRVMVVANVATQAALLLPVWLPCAALLVSYCPPSAIEPDHFFGIYIRACAVQLTLIWRFGPMPILPPLLLVSGLTMPFAILSWYLIEAPALGMKERLRRWRCLAPPVVAAAA